MATKYLARTVIEAGRRGAKWGRRRDNRGARGLARAEMRAIVAGAGADEWSVPRVIKRNRFLGDKLSPLARWLGSQCGRPWNKVRGELSARFDARTTAGRHIIEHARWWVDTGWNVPGLFHCNVPFVVDAHGILRRSKKH
jgi:hypothetical protein